MHSFGIAQELHICTFLLYHMIDFAGNGIRGSRSRHMGFLTMHRRLNFVLNISAVAFVKFLLL